MIDSTVLEIIQTGPPVTLQNLAQARIQGCELDNRAVIVAVKVLITLERRTVDSFEKVMVSC